MLGIKIPSPPASQLEQSREPAISQMLIYAIVFKPAHLRSASLRSRPEKKKPQTILMGLCHMCGKIFLLHGSGGVNGDNPMFLCSVIANGGEVKLI